MPNPVASLCGNAVSAVADTVVECMDVDGVVRKINLNEALLRVDFDAVLDRIDLNRVLARIDINRVLDSIDMDAVINKVDVNSVIQRSDLSGIIAQSTTGVFTGVLDKLRTQLAVMDLVIFRMKRFHFFRSGRLPPGPAECDLEETNVPKVRIDQAIAVQGRYCGFLSKAVAIFVDTLFLTLTFAGFLILLQLAWILFVDKDGDSDAKSKISKEKLWVVVLYCLYWGQYFFVSVLATGQTIGMAITGITVVDAATGGDITTLQAALRTAILPLSTTIFPFLGLLGFYRRDGRMLHDLIAGTGLVYSWDAEVAKFRAQAMKRVRKARSEQYLLSSSSQDDETDDPTQDGGRAASLLDQEEPDHDGGGNQRSPSYSTFEADRARLALQ